MIGPAEPAGLSFSDMAVIRPPPARRFRHAVQGREPAGSRLTFVLAYSSRYSAAATEMRRCIPHASARRKSVGRVILRPFLSWAT